MEENMVLNWQTRFLWLMLVGFLGWSSNSLDNNQIQTLKFGDVDPAPRYLHSLCIWDNCLFVFGGLLVTKLANDTFRVIEDANLDMFARKENVISQSRSFNGYFAFLPTEVTQYLLSFFSATELVKLCGTNKYFRSVCSSDILWKPLVIEHITCKLGRERARQALQNMEEKFSKKNQSSKNCGVLAHSRKCDGHQIFILEIAIFIVLRQEYFMACSRATEGVRKCCRMLLSWHEISRVQNRMLTLNVGLICS